MSSYFIATVKVTDDSWVPDYAAKVHDLAAKHGGKYLSRSGNIETLKGLAPDATLIAVIEFPDRASIQAWLDDAEYKPFLEARYAGERIGEYDPGLAGSPIDIPHGATGPNHPEHGRSRRPAYLDRPDWPYRPATTARRC